MNNVRHINTLNAVRKQSEGAFVLPELLHDILPVTSTVILTFRSEKAMRSYRSMLYVINKQGSFRYRTIRDEMSMWGLVIWRMR